MKAICTKKQTSCKDEKIPYWEIKAGRKTYAKIWYPWSGNGNEYRVEFPHGTMTGCEDIFAAAEKCAKWCAEYFGITEIADKKGYPIDLLAAFESPLLADVC